MSSKRKSAALLPEKQGEPEASVRQAKWFLRLLIIASVAVVAFGIVLLKDQRQSAPALPATPVSPASAMGDPTAQSNPAAVNGPFKPSSPADQLNQALAGGKPALVFMHSTTCQSCIDMTKVVNQIYPEFADRIALVDVDVYDEANGPLMEELGLRYIPTVVTFDKEGKTAQNVGAMKAVAFRSFLLQNALGD